ncbi:putative pre-mRNA polyadenylation factor FIP1 [Planoprotostelium fungivorum]|uniref:Putative pre-mRNA polyadenylation factor FIP1 n=1 Tax=Planoprotostelium fungivorum TaxID=1890364 RepID=A0A2P6NT26_9EUKA|nr:putative pre-mRNA polyadenylation factor FIP1 [Planoprotostelium fungivorum]
MEDDEDTALYGAPIKEEKADSEPVIQQESQPQKTQEPQLQEPPPLEEGTEDQLAEGEEVEEEAEEEDEDAPLVVVNPDSAKKGDGYKLNFLTQKRGQPATTPTKSGEGQANSNPTLTGSLPPGVKSVLDTEMDNLEDKPWRKPGVDITDYFNYGFNEESWRNYVSKQVSMRAELSSTQIPVYSEEAERRTTPTRGRGEETTEEETIEGRDI